MPRSAGCCHAGVESLPTFIAPAQIMGGKTVKSLRMFV
jgi:hypothetical protein